MKDLYRTKVVYEPVNLPDVHCRSRPEWMNV